MDENPEGYAITTSHLPYATAMECPSCPSSIIWIILLIVAILVIIGLVIWLIVKYHRDRGECTGCTGAGSAINFTNANVRVDSDTQITGTWTTTDSGDIVTLYATLHPPRFNALGGLDNPTAATNFNRAGSPNASGGTGNTGATGMTGTIGTVNTVSLPGLLPGLKYYATLIARNANTNNYKSYTQIVYMEDGTIPTNVAGATGSTVLNTFEIQDILQVGAIQVQSDNPSNGVYNVLYNQRPRQTRDLFYLNSSGQLQLSDANGLSDVCLFNNGGNLVATTCMGVTGAAFGSASNNGQWVYNPNKNANKICLKNTVDSDNPTCLKLTGLRNGTGTVSVVQNTDSGDAWALAFENPQ